MRVFLAGATGAIGRPLVARLLDAGHEVVGTTRSAESAAALRERGAEAVVLDAFDAEAVRAAVLAAEPEVLIHQLTALPAAIDPRHYAKALEATSRLRALTPPAFLAAAREAGTRRAIFQSVSFLVGPEGPAVVDESAPPFANPPKQMRGAAEATQAMERMALEAGTPEGVVLRYGFFYGPGTSIAPDGAIVGEVRRRRFPVIGAGTGTWSFVHVDDAAAATVRALDRGAPGTFNVTDDDPAPLGEWLPALAAAAGAPPPRHVPAWVGRLAAGPHTVHTAVTMRGNDNAKARRELGFEPAWPTWRDGFPALFGAAAAAPALSGAR